MKLHTISLLVNNHPGVLHRVAGLFGRRGFNIESITVGQSEELGLSRMTIETSGDNKTLDQVKKQLNKLIDVVTVVDLSANTMVARELVLIKVRVLPHTRPEIFSIINIFRAFIIDVSLENLIVQATGDRIKIAKMIELLVPYGILEISRTGVTAMACFD
ncbi:acetolactate synthase small subunit [Paenibacillus psychroresistens]|uniref:Acetolactate synthase small subunit n=1 Tax=Paenibacillus psychroresistens TaxID=1778678 RepID=A0A6B8RPL3_9BACL|nr:acetolactate synthase small subunit [Paenibacillus psychroresistens]QGQ97632.1 acetolactate synthase small subunit [Paenibacillus psychroresistens]